jgi:integrase
MPRAIRNSKLESRSQRLKLPTKQPKPFWVSVASGVSLGYRRPLAGAGSWSVRCADGAGSNWTRVFGYADDHEPADNKHVFDFWQAQAQARALARGGGGEADATAPITVSGALDAYKADLLSRGADPYNATNPRKHLTASLLSMPVQLLGSKSLKAWRDSLLGGKLAPATINRLANSICAALELARRHDPRIKNRDSWETGLAGLPDAQRARNVVLSDEVVHAFVAAAYRHDQQLGLFCDLLATTGCRPSQAARLCCEDLHDHATKPKVMLPKSAKGGGRNRSAKKSERYSVPLTLALAKRLKAAAAGRAPDSALLLCADGSSWGDDPSLKYRRPVREVFEAIGENPDEVSLYSLRHSNITRMLLRNVPVRLIASLHNTSIFQIEKNYSKHITEHAIDDISRAGLLSEPAPAAKENVIPLRKS